MFFSCSSSCTAQQSLNREARLRELKRITKENQSMLQRIQSREPYYDHKKWEAEREQDLKYLNNITSREVMSLTARFTNTSLPPLPHAASSPR